MAVALKSKAGKKVDPKKLVEEQARPASKGPRPWKYTSPGAISPTKLAGIFKKSDAGDLVDLITLASEIERRDSHVGAQLRTRRLALAGLPWVVEAASDSALDVQIADAVQALVRRHEFRTLVFDLLDGILKPFAVAEIIWEFGESWTPASYAWRDQRSFAIDPEDGTTILLKTDAAPKGEPLAEWKYIVHSPRQVSGPLTTAGLIRTCASMYVMKQLGLTSWLGYVELFGIPWRIGRYSQGTNTSDQDALAEALAMLGMDGTAMLPDSAKLEVLNAQGGAGSSIHRDLADWCDRQTSKAILGQTLTADTGGGSYAQGSVHDGIRRTILAADAVDLAATLQRDLIEPYVRINFGEQVIYPTLRCVVEEPEDTRAFVETLAPMIDRGLTVEQSVIRDRLSLPAPEAGAAILSPVGALKSPAQAPAV